MPTILKWFCNAKFVHTHSTYSSTREYVRSTNSARDTQTVTILGVRIKCAEHYSNGGSFRLQSQMGARPHEWMLANPIVFNVNPMQHQWSDIDRQHFFVSQAQFNPGQVDICTCCCCFASRFLWPLKNCAKSRTSSPNEFGTCPKKLSGHKVHQNWSLLFHHISFTKKPKTKTFRQKFLPHQLCLQRSILNTFLQTFPFFTTFFHQNIEKFNKKFHKVQWQLRDNPFRTWTRRLIHFGSFRRIRGWEYLTGSKCLWQYQMATNAERQK